MKISIKDKDMDIVKCDNCEWEGQIQDADWMDDYPFSRQFGLCPDCGEDQFTKKDVYDIIEWQWDGWKAQIAVWSIICAIMVFGVVPWFWGVCDILRRIF